MPADHLAQLAFDGSMLLTYCHIFWRLGLGPHSLIFRFIIVEGDRPAVGLGRARQALRPQGTGCTGRLLKAVGPGVVLPIASAFARAMPCRASQRRLAGIQGELLRGESRTLWG